MLNVGAYAPVNDNMLSEDFVLVIILVLEKIGHSEYYSTTEVLSGGRRSCGAVNLAEGDSFSHRIIVAVAIHPPPSPNPPTPFPPGKGEHLIWERNPGWSTDKPVPFPGGKGLGVR